ncbi:ATP-binding protein, partial [Oceaniovalibus guishaninsula]|uniref:ATP-binding protein n=1 Tax=Oceaniovalibus guishaninsula TaxID=1046117 RepID=UPI000689A824
MTCTAVPPVRRSLWVGPFGGIRAGIGLRRWPLARKIIAVNLVANLVLVAGIVVLDPFRGTLIEQRQAGLRAEAALIARIAAGGLTEAPGDWTRIGDMFAGLPLGEGIAAFVHDAQGRPVAAFGAGPAGGSPVADTTDVLSASAPIYVNGIRQGVVVLSSDMAGIDRLVAAARGNVLGVVLVTLLVSIWLGLTLAAAIAKPLSDLADAAEIGRDAPVQPDGLLRVSIPDMTDRLDEIGRLSGALRGMVAALYDRSDANERFAADVAHELKNPLASLRSAAGSLRMVRRDDQRHLLLDVIDHDVRRLDRLVSDISDASRLDSELVKEDQRPFDLVAMLMALCGHMERQARDRGMEIVTDMPQGPIVIDGLESRLAQVFVNLIANAVSLCEDGDAVRVWVRRRANRVLAVVEDTGPGIPGQSLARIFDRFYSERPATQFGNNSGLGLSIAKQIVEAHGGVIWAENIQPT